MHCRAFQINIIPKHMFFRLEIHAQTFEIVVMTLKNQDCFKTRLFTVHYTKG